MMTEAEMWQAVSEDRTPPKPMPTNWALQRIEVRGFAGYWGEEPALGFVITQEEQEDGLTVRVFEERLAALRRALWDRGG